MYRLPVRGPGVARHRPEREIAAVTLRCMAAAMLGVPATYISKDMLWGRINEHVLLTHHDGAIPSERIQP